MLSAFPTVEKYRQKEKTTSKSGLFHFESMPVRSTRVPPTHYDDTHGLSHEPTDLALGGPSPIGNIQPSGLAFDSGQATHYTERHSHDDTRPPTRQTNTAHIGLALPRPTPQLQHRPSRSARKSKPHQKPSSSFTRSIS